MGICYNHIHLSNPGIKKNIKEFICWQINNEWIPYFSLVIQLSLCLHEFCKHQRHGKCHCVRILNLVQAQRDSSYWGALYSSSQQVPKLISPISDGYFSLYCTNPVVFA